MFTGISPLAVQVKGRTTGIRKRTPWGLLFHTTGGGVTDLAVHTRKTVKGKIVRTKRAKPSVPSVVAVDLYIKMQNGSEGYPWGGPGYVMDHDGNLFQIADDTTLTNHCGSGDRAYYLGDTWKGRCSPAIVAQWAHKWPKYKHPYQLFPSKSPNTDYVGVEMIPCGDGFGTPLRKGLRFTKAQHDACITFAVDMAARLDFPKGWEKTSRLIGHEDIQPINRFDTGGGWDPGWLRESPYFDFDYVRQGISKAPAHPLICAPKAAAKKPTKRTNA